MRESQTVSMIRPWRCSSALVRPHIRTGRGARRSGFCCRLPAVELPCGPCRPGAISDVRRLFPAELCAVDIVGRLAVRSSAGIGRRAALAEEVLAAVDGGRALQRALAAGGLGTPPSRRPRLPVVAMEPEQAAGGADPEEDGLCVRE